MFSGWLTAIVFLPVIGALLIAVLPINGKTIKYIAALISVIELILAISVFAMYDNSKSGFQLVDKFSDWIPIESFRVEYILGVDGLSAPLILLTGLLGVAAIFASWNVQFREKEYFIWLLVIQTAVMGVFTSLDLVLFFIFWELELLPMFLLISIWGSGRKEYSAMKFFIFTILGGACMLVSILVLFFSVGTFNIMEIPLILGEWPRLLLPPTTIFIFFFIGFAIKLPVWPLHSWLPDAHTDAPTAVSIILAGVLLKMGGYGLIRIAVGFFPAVAVNYAWVLASLATISILYGAIVTVRQTDLKRLIAFSSISHMGFVLLGISSVIGVGGVVSSVGLTGAALQMFTHGTITGLLFLLVGLIYEKAQTRHIPDLGGLANKMPLVTVALLIGGLASLGLPGLSGFPAEITIFLGTFPVWSWLTAISAFSIVFTAGYILWTIQRTVFGPTSSRFTNIQDVNIVEGIPILILIIPIFAIGIYPALLSNVFSVGVSPIIESVQNALRVSIP